MHASKHTFNTIGMASLEMAISNFLQIHTLAQRVTAENKRMGPESITRIQ